MKTKALILAVAGVAAFAAPVAAQAQTNPLSAIFQCNNANNRQGTGAAIGGVAGALLGNRLAGDDDELLGTLLGAAVGAAVGSYVGCNMNSAGGDTAQAEAATRLALDQNRSQTWSNARTGASGRIDIVRSFNRNAGQGDPYYGGPQPLNQIRFVRGVQQPSNYTLVNDTYRANSTVNLRAGPNTRSPVLGQLRYGEQFQALARLNDGWLLVGQNGVATGYVAERVVQLVSRGGAYDGGYNGRGTGTYDQGYNDGYADGLAVARGGVPTRRGGQVATREQLCRTFDQTVQQRDGYNRVTERFTACQSAGGEWVVL